MKTPKTAPLSSLVGLCLGVTCALAPGGAVAGERAPDQAALCRAARRLGATVLSRGQGPTLRPWLSEALQFTRLCIAESARCKPSSRRWLGALVDTLHREVWRLPRPRGETAAWVRTHLEPAEARARGRVGPRPVDPGCRLLRRLVVTPHGEPSLRALLDRVAQRTAALAARGVDRTTTPESSRGWTGPRGARLR